MLVVGGLGYIGRRVVEELLARGEDVKVLDRARDVKTPQGATVVKGDATDFSTLYDTMRGAEAVVNLAAYINVEESVSRPQEYLRNNVTTHLNVLEAARRLGVERIILASSAAVYGDAQPPLREESEKRPVNPYGLSKLICEQLSDAYHRGYGIGTIVLRYFNVLGEGGRNVLKIFVENVFNRRPLTVRGRWIGGVFTPASRDFVYVGDVAEATVKALSVEPRMVSINIAGGSAVSVDKLARMVLESLGEEVEIVFAELAPHEPLTSWADISRAKQILGWEPKTPLAMVVKKYVEWFGEKMRG